MWIKVLLPSSLFLSSAVGKPCDIYMKENSPCVAAHSTIRSLYDNYHGPLYQLNRTDDGLLLNISTNDAGYADSVSHEEFCDDKACVIQIIFDQSPMGGNHLHPSPASPSHYGRDDEPPRWEPGTPVDAMKHKVIVNGTYHVYGALFEQGNGYRLDKTKGIATGNEEETIYMVTSGKYYNNRCCFDYGNAEIDNMDDGDGTMVGSLQTIQQRIILKLKDHVTA